MTTSQQDPTPHEPTPHEPSEHGPAEHSLTELVVTQHVPAPVDQVWAAWTSAEAWARWWWPQWPDTEYEVDARPGGTYLARSVEGDAWVTGEFTTVEAPHLLEMTLRWDEPVEDTVRVELTDSPGDDGTPGTLVTVRHRTDPAGMDNYRMGWEFVLGNLAQLDADSSDSASSTDSSSPS